MKVLDRIREYLRVSRIALSYAFKLAYWKSIALIVLSSIMAVLPLMSFLFLGKLVNQLVQANDEGAKMSMILSALITYVLIVGAPKVFMSIKAYVDKVWYYEMNLKMETFLLKKRLEIDIYKYENPEFQNLMQRAFKHSFWPLFDLGSGQITTFRLLISFTVGTVLALQFGILIYAILMISALPGFYTQLKYSSGIWNIWKEDSANQRRILNIKRYFEIKHSIVETKLLQSGKRLLDWIESILGSFHKEQTRVEKKRLKMMLLSETISIIGFIGAALLLVQNLFAQSDGIGNLIFALGILSTLRNSTQETVMNVAQQYERHLTAIDIINVLNYKPRENSNLESKVKLNLETPPLIEFRDVSFKYPASSNWNLRDINLTIRPGEKIALVGNNGAGKSTLIKLICKIYEPTEGFILINGVDIRNISEQELWTYLGVMMQDYANYDFVVKDTISIGRIDAPADIDRIKHAAQMSASAEFIEKWKEQYENPIGLEFGGVEPSKGQRQKLALAKILFRNPYLMILDEPTASIDIDSETAIFESLNDLPKSTSLILITHNFSVIRGCDQIIYFEKGRIKEIGTHESLLSQNSSYANTFQHQASKYA